jgi:hypothetical protein
VLVRSRYNQVVALDQETEPLSLGSVVDDLLGLRLDDDYLVGADADYLFRTESRYGDSPEPHDWSVLFAVRPDDESSEDELLPVPNDLDDSIASFVLGAVKGIDVRNVVASIVQLRSEFEAAAKAASRGFLDERLAPYLSRTRHFTDGVVEVDGLPTLAAWALQEKLRDGPIKLACCPMCERPWLPDRDATYCRRLAPYAFWTNCREVAKHQAFRQRDPYFLRERKNLYERVRRGSLERTSYDRWLAVNRPGDLGETWVTFDKWQTGGTPNRIRRRKGASDGARQRSS